MRKRPFGGVRRDIFAPERGISGAIFWVLILLWGNRFFGGFFVSRGGVLLFCKS
jgi:hypothetical protein